MQPIGRSTVTYRQPAGLFVPVADAAMVAAALRALEREYRSHGLRLDARAAALRTAAEELATGVAAERRAEPEPEQWITAEAAAAMLGLSERYTRDLPGIRHLRVGRHKLLALIDVEEEAAARRAAAAGFRKIGEAA